MLGKVATDKGLESTKDVQRQRWTMWMPLNNCTWPAEKPAPDWTPLYQGPGPSMPTSSMASVPTFVD